MLIYQRILVHADSKGKLCVRVFYVCVDSG